MPHVMQGLLTLPVHLRSPRFVWGSSPVSMCSVLCVSFVNCCLYLWYFSFFLPRRCQLVFEFGCPFCMFRLCFRKDLLSTTEITHDTDYESYLNKTENKNRKWLHTGFYYRPPDNRIESIESLYIHITCLANTFE